MLLPPDLLRLAELHRARQQELARRATQALRQLWTRVDPAAALASWQASASPAAVATMMAAQSAAAYGVDDYAAAALNLQGVDGADTAGIVNTRALAGVASDGRALDTLLEQPAWEVDAFVADGMDGPAALLVGSRHLERIVATQVADAARVATGVATVARRRAGGYIRMLTPPSCSRCAVLAGKFYRTNTGFQRHPHCDCVHIPAAESLRGAVTSPRDYFDSLPAAEQDRVFTRAGAQAIRDGADVGQVVNARRGMATAAGPGGRRHLAATRLFGRDLYITTEGTTSRGVAGRRLGAGDTRTRTAEDRYRRAQKPRLMPESIYEITGGDRDEAIRLLKANGYLL